ncbi:MAG: Yip1 family protein [Gemmatimonadota bacterium]
MIERMKGAALLDINTYEEVEADTSATTQAAGVVLIVAVAQAIGASGVGIMGMFMALVSAFLGWLIWAGVTYLIGDKLLGGTATWGELLRTLGFAQTPGILAILAFIPLLGWLVRIVVGVWVLVAGVIAIRQACDFSTGKAILTAVLGWLAIMIPAAILAAGAQ